MARTPRAKRRFAAPGTPEQHDFDLELRAYYYKLDLPQPNPNLMRTYKIDMKAINRDAGEQRQIAVLASMQRVAMVRVLEVVQDGCEVGEYGQDRTLGTVVNGVMNGRPGQKSWWDCSCKNAGC